jgi:hypothetical protein
MKNGIDLQEDAAAQARMFWPDCLRMLAHISEHGDGEAVRAAAWCSLTHSLVMIREFVRTTADADAREQATEALKAFLNS